MSKKKKKRNPPAFPKVKRTPVQLEEDLQRQIRLLRNSTKLFDEGEIDEACNIATRIRILVHDSGLSDSLLFKQVGINDMLFFDTAFLWSKDSLGPYHGLIGIEFSPNPKWCWFPNCFFPDDQSRGEQRIPFDSWWSAIVLNDKHGVVFSRRDIILALCNKDGGAHVAPELDDRYERLEKSKEFAYLFGSDNGSITPPVGAGMSTVRQIGYEIMLTLREKYPQYFSGIYLRPANMEFSPFAKLAAALVISNAEENSEPDKE